MAARPSVWANAARLAHRTVAAPAVNWAARVQQVQNAIHGTADGGGGDVDLSFLNSPQVQAQLAKKQAPKKKTVTHKAPPRATVTVIPDQGKEKPKPKAGVKGGKPSDISPEERAARQDPATKVARAQAVMDTVFGGLNKVIGQAHPELAGGATGAPGAAPAAAGANGQFHYQKGGGKGDPNDPYSGMNHYEKLVAGGKIHPNDMQILVSSAAHNPYGQDIIMSASQLRQEFYSSDSATIADWQAKLLAAGLYRNQTKYYTRKNPADPMTGQLDHDTVQAFDDMLHQASIQNGLYRRNGDDVKAKRVGPLLGGQGGDVEDLLATRSDAFLEALGESNRRTGDGSGSSGGGRSSGGGDGGGGGSGGGGTTYQVEDPAQLRAMTNVIAQELIGKALPEDQMAKIIAQIQGNQVSSESIAGGVAPSVDPESEIAQLIRQFQPVESQAHDMVSMYDNFTKMLGPMSNSSMVNSNTQGF